MVFPVYHADARGILTATSGFLADARFSPARNCTFGCTYCYVPTMRIYGGLKIDQALDATDRNIVADPFHVRTVKTSGATSREAAERISKKQGYGGWHEPGYQSAIVEIMRVWMAGGDR